MKRATLEELLASFHAGRPVVLATHLATGEQRILRAHDQRGRERRASPRCLRRRRRGWAPVVPPAVELAAAHDPRRRRPHRAAARRDGGDGGLRRHRRRPAPAVRHRRALPGCDDLRASGPTARSRRSPPTRALPSSLSLTTPSSTSPALAVALRSPAFYVGALGSRKSHAERCERLRARGLTRRGARAHPRAGRPRPRRAHARRDRRRDPGRGDAAPARAAVVKFGPLPAAEAEGAILAHTLRLPSGGVLKKGRVLSAADVAALAASGRARGGGGAARGRRSGRGRRRGGVGAGAGRAGPPCGRGLHRTLQPVRGSARPPAGRPRARSTASTRSTSR